MSALPREGVLRAARVVASALGHQQTFAVWRVSAPVGLSLPDRNDGICDAGDYQE